MAIATDPDQRIKIPLACTDDVPEEKRPHLLCRAMSRRDHDEYERLIEEAQTAPNDKAACIVLERALGLAVKGWVNVVDDADQPRPFGPDAWMTYTRLQLYSLAMTLPKQLSLAEADFFTSPLAVPPVRTARAAATTDTGTAAIPQPPKTPNT